MNKGTVEQYQRQENVSMKKRFLSTKQRTKAGKQDFINGEYEDIEEEDDRKL